MTDDSKSKDKKNVKEILATAKERFALASEAESEIRQAALDDLRFRAGDQWPEDVKRARDIDRRPCLVINRIPQFIRQVTNDQRQNRPAIKVNPFDDQADVETAKVLQGIIRHIEYNSNADVAYDTAFDHAVTSGFGYLRVITDYCDPYSFDQEILIKRVRNPFTVYLDPNYHEPDGSDANWGFIVTDMSRDDYEAEFKDSEMCAIDDWESIGDQAPEWATKDTCRVAEYFYKTFKETTLVLLNTKEVIEKSKLPEVLPEGIEIVAERKTTLPAIKWCKINAVEILEETEWIGQWIPIVPVLGDELNIEGKRILEGIVRHARDPQRMYNYWATSETETIALAPRAPFIGVEGQFEGHEHIWKTANTKNHAYLEYKPVSIAGVPVPPPTRNVFEPPVQAITNARMQSSEDLKATTGIYDASLGARSNEKSGIAIQRRNQQAQTSNFHFIDNLSRSLRHLGRVLIELIPKVYDTPRMVRILGEDGEPQMVAINQVFEDKGEIKSHMLSKGKYDVTVTTGPSYATKRQEAVESMLSLTQAYPQVAQVAGDLMVKNMDWPGAQEIAERIRKTLPPGIAEPKDGEQKPVPPEVQQQMTQMNQVIEQLTEKLNEAQDKLDNKKIELESKERIEMQKLQVQLQIEMAKLDAQDGRLLFEAELADLERRLNLLGMNEPIQVDPEMENQTDLQGAGPEQEAEMPVEQPFTGEQQAPGQFMEQ